MAKKCELCGEAATHGYSGMKVCASDYKTLAANDDSPKRIPSDYDWDSEMKGRKL